MSRFVSLLRLVDLLAVVLLGLLWLECGLFLSFAQGWGILGIVVATVAYPVVAVVVPVWALVAGYLGPMVVAILFVLLAGTRIRLVQRMERRAPAHSDVTLAAGRIHTPSAGSDERAEGGRLLFGPNGTQVAWLLAALQRRDPVMWEALAGAQLGKAGGDQAEWWRWLDLTVEEAGRRGLGSGALSTEDVSAAKEAAEEAARAALPVLVDRLMQRTAEPRERVSAIFGNLSTNAAVTAATLLVVRPFLGEGVFEKAWEPYAQVLYRDARTRARWPGLDGAWADAADRNVTQAGRDGLEASRVRAEPWHADAVVDLQALASRWFAEGHGLPDSVLIVPNPYFVLPLDALVKWEFATAVECAKPSVGPRRTRRRSGGRTRSFERS